MRTFSRHISDSESKKIRDGKGNSPYTRQKNKENRYEESNTPYTLVNIQAVENRPSR